MSIPELEKKLDEELNKKDSDRFVVEKICSEILADKNCSTNLIRKIYEYLDNGAITLWGSFPYDELESNKISPFNIFAKKVQHNHIADILFMSYVTDTPEVFSIIRNYLREKKCETKKEVKEIIYTNLTNPNSDEYKNLLNKFKNEALPKSLFATKKNVNRIFYEEILKMMHHLSAGYNLFSKIDELLFDFELPPSPYTSLYINEYDYWRIVFYIKLLCSKDNDRVSIIKHLSDGSVIDEIVKEFVSSRAGFFARTFFPKYYKYEWIKKVRNIHSDIIRHIT